MNYYKKILKYLIPIWIIVSVNFSQDLSIDLIILNTGEFSKIAFDNSADLWSVSITNTTNQEIKYKIKFQLKDLLLNQIALEGRTKELPISPNTTDSYSNRDGVLDDSNLEYWSGGEEAEYFISNYLSAGYLKQGSYILIVSVVTPDSPYNVIDEDVSDEIEFSVGNLFSNDYPDDEQIITGASELYFQWSTPGFRQGVQIEFRLIIAAIVPGESDNPGVAIDYGEANTVYHFDSNWECAMYVRKRIVTGDGFSKDTEIFTGYDWAVEYCTVKGEPIEHRNKLINGYDNAKRKTKSAVIIGKFEEDYYD